MTQNEILHALSAAPIVPVFYHDDLEKAKDVLQECYEGGVRVFELTNRGAAAPRVFEGLRTHAQSYCPGLVLGIGTIYDVAMARVFTDLATDFIVQPITTPEVGVYCAENNRAWIPGAMTPTEIYHAHQLGAAVVKVFPGNAVSPDYIKAIQGPMPFIKIMVTGGVEPTTDSLDAWLSAGAMAVGMGSQLFKPSGQEALSARLSALFSFVNNRKK